MATRETAETSIVRGRLRHWQFVMIGVGLGVLATVIKGPIWTLFGDHMMARLCDNGWLGISVGWWYVVGAFSLPAALTACVAFTCFQTYRGTKKYKQFPYPNRKPLLDTTLLAGEPLQRYARKNLIGGWLALVATTFLIYQAVDISKFGRNMSPKEQVECRKSVNESNRLHRNAR